MTCIVWIVLAFVAGVIVDFIFDPLSLFKKKNK